MCYRKWSSDDYKVDCRNRSFGIVEALKPVNTHYVEATNFEIYRRTLQLQKNNGHTAGKIGKGVKRMNTRIKTTIYSPSDLVSVLFLLRKGKTQVILMASMRSCYVIFSPFYQKPPRATLPHCISARLKIIFSKKEARRGTAEWSATHLKPTQLMISFQKPKLTSQTTNSPKICPAWGFQ